MALDPIRALLQKKKSLALGWAALGNPFAVELMGRAGIDVINIDHQHGQGGPAELVNQLIAARAANVPALVRVATNDEGLISRALDAGARGIICPMINTAGDAKRLVRSVKYPPQGARSYGPYAASLLIAEDYFGNANDWTIACAQVETAESLGNLDAILGVEDLDMILVGPNDLSISLSNGKSREPKSAEMQKAIDHIHARATKYGILTAIYAVDEENAKDLIHKGWQLVALASDSVWISAGARAFAALTKAT